jgi:hypothetical protein
MKKQTGEWVKVEGHLHGLKVGDIVRYKDYEDCSWIGGEFKPTSKNYRAITEVRKNGNVTISKSQHYDYTGPITDWKFFEKWVSAKVEEGGLVRGYHVSNRAYYKDAVRVPRILFGVYKIGDGAPWEGVIEWIELQGKLCPKVSMFADSWHLFGEFSDFFKCLSKNEGEDLTQDQVIAILNKCCFKDLTEYVQKK